MNTTIMTKKEKQLLLKDLCARLLYGVKVHIIDATGAEIDDELTTSTISHFDRWVVKPYLRPMSSMIEEEKTVFDNFCVVDEFVWKGNLEKGFSNQATIMSDGIDYLLSRHLDFRGLIQMGLALEAPKNMYKENNYDKKTKRIYRIYRRVYQWEIYRRT